MLMRIVSNTKIGNKNSCEKSRLPSRAYLIFDKYVFKKKIISN